MKRRKTEVGAVYHICQQSRVGGLLFYSPSDYLVLFTLICSLARKTGQQILALCLMPDHIHHVETAGSGAALSDFVQQYTQSFAWQWNRLRGRKGPLFRPYEGALNRGSMQIRAALAYLYNHPVERKLVSRAEAYRWSFLPYARQPFPFSPPLVRKKLHRPMLRILREAEACFTQGKGLNYAQLHRWMGQLSPIEQQQLTDFIIGLWNVIDYESAAAFHNESGSGHERDQSTDAVYTDCTRLLLREGYIHAVEEIPMLPAREKEQLYELLYHRTTAQPKQICQYLHLPYFRIG